MMNHNIIVGSMRGQNFRDRAIWTISDVVTFLFLQDYGMWERGDKTNQGIPELNGSSVGMAKVQKLHFLFIVVNINDGLHYALKTTTTKLQFSAWTHSFDGCCRQLWRP